MVNRIVLVPHDPSWAVAFSRAAEESLTAFGSNLVEFHHIGSTSIPGIHAKPILDMLAVVNDVGAVDQHNVRFESIGYVPKGEFGIPGRRFFYRNDATGLRTHQIHTFRIGSPDVLRHLAFRDYLIAHPHIATSYSDLKRRLAETHYDNREAYMDGKDAFIKDVETKALTWAAIHRSSAVL